MKRFRIPETRTVPLLPIVAALALVPFALGAGACAPEGEEPADRPAERAEEGAEETGQGLEETGRRVGEELEEAGESIERGAERVGDELEPAARDAQITATVKSKLLSDPEVSGFKIDVDTSGGRVTLSGTVDSEAAKEEAEELARNTEGVEEVENLIEVAPEGG